MKMIFFKTIVLFNLCFFNLVIGQCIIEGTVKHRFLRAGWNSRGVEIFNEHGKSEWLLACKDELSDAWSLPDGGVVYSFSRRKQDEAGVIRLDKDKKVLWEYRVEKGRDNHSCQPLPGGGFLLGESAPNGLWMVELDAQGQLYQRIKVGDWTKDYHHAFRQVRKTQEGTYLGTIMTDNKTYEWNKSGQLLRTFPNGVYVAIRLPNGNTLTSGRSEFGPVIEYDQAGKMVWSVTKEDLPFHLNMACGLHRLPNGNTVISNIWHGKHTNKSAPMLYEITRNKEIVWRVYTPGGNMGNVQILDVDANVFKGELLK